MKTKEEILQAAETLTNIAERSAERGELDQATTAIAISSALRWCAGELALCFELMLRNERENQRRAEQSFKN